MTTRAIIDYAEDGNASAMRDALYSAIQDRVTAHIEAKKQEIAHGMIAQEDTQTENDNEEYTEE